MIKFALPAVGILICLCVAAGIILSGYHPPETEQGRKSVEFALAMSGLLGGVLTFLGLAACVDDEDDEDE